MMAGTRSGDLEAALRTFLLLGLLAGGAAGPAQAQSLQLSGTTGYLSEWELTGNVSATASGRAKEFSGPLIVRHIGLCSQNGPEEKAAEIKFQISKWGPGSEIRATMTVDGNKCTFGGRLSDTYSGFMDCADAKGVPVTISLK
jgi:hypothetical protein